MILAPSSFIRQSSKRTARNKETQIFINQPIFTRHQKIDRIYKLISGKAALVDSKTSKIIHQYPEGSLLNYYEIYFNQPMSKTIKAVGKCEILKIQQENLKITSRPAQIQERNISILANLKNSQYFQVVQHFEHEFLANGNRVIFVPDKTYFLVQGSLVVKTRLFNKVLIIPSGQILTTGMALHDFIYECSAQKVEVVSIENKILKLLIGGQFEALWKVDCLKMQQMQKLEARGERLSENHRKGRLSENHRKERFSLRERKKILEEAKAPPTSKFMNPIEFKVQQLQKYHRAKSCFRLENKSTKDFIHQNTLKYKELVDLNRRKYGQDYVYNKRLEISRKVFSVSNPDEWKQCQYNDENHNIYESYTLKDHFGVVRKHPEIINFNKSRRSNLNSSVNSERQKPADINLKTLKKVRMTLENAKNMFIKIEAKKQANLQLPNPNQYL